ncbi:ribokinase [Herbiconiux sp. L3-i23]|uniref:ribokinase n=1 Tax=Herbiconiux sp. L3-i23 TaxID=2905871 RepID=UPI00205937F7|nr:ribokinase [Herbiconiux sp. L3-i23]BDI21540.1 ribokinase [Herbiconiux sp. L3-i23]
MDRRGRITVLGSANMDLVVRQPRLPKPGETMFGSHFSTVPGGKGLNQAVAAARAGGAVTFAGAIGDDAFGTELRIQMEADGIAVSTLRVTDAPTGTAHISVVDGGENSIVVVSGANAAIPELDDNDRGAIADSDWLLVQFERPQPLVAEALRHARSVGTKTMLTPAPVQPVDEELWSFVDVLVPNEHEACELAGLDDEQDAAVWLSERVGTVVMTRGSRGALVCREGAVVVEVAARKVDAVDTTGAGDTFVGVLAARLAAGDELETALHAATAGAAISVTRAGATSSMPVWSEIAATL